MPEIDPLEIALRNVVECRRTLEKLITSSESFDYHGAKAALGTLQERVRDLGRIQARFEELKRRRAPRIQVVDFRESGAARPSASGPV